MTLSVPCIAKQLLSESLDQKAVRNLKKVLESLQSSDQEQLTTEVVKNLRQLLQDDPVTALSCVGLFSGGCRVLQDCVNGCMSEILSACIDGLQTEGIKESSRFHVSCKAIYSILQIICAQKQTPMENSIPRNQLQLLSELLTFAIADDSLPSDCAIVVATSLCLAFSLYVKVDLSRKFFSLLKIIEDYEGHRDKEAVTTSVEQLQKLQFDDDVRIDYGNLKISCPLVLALNGLLNSNLWWIYSPRCCVERKSLSSGNSHGIICGTETETSAFSDDKDSESAKALELHEVSLNEYYSSEFQKCNQRRVFLYDLYPFISKSCRESSSYSFQAFQGLFTWLQCIRKMTKEHLLLYGVSMKNCSFCISPSNFELFAIQSHHGDSAFHLLNSNWESPSKGVSDIVYRCMSELIEIHEEESGGQGEAIALQMVNNLVHANAWSLKSTYPPLALAMSFASAENILREFPSIPESLLESLAVNYLAPAGANVYKIILSRLESSVWCEYFLSLVIKVLHSPDRMVRQNTLTLWLPVTVRQYPGIYVELLNRCHHSTTEGWLARMAILKVARSCGNEDILENISLKCDNLPTITNESKSDQNVHAVPGSSMLRYAISHIDETVRSEALALLCNTKKASLPVSREEATLLKDFFTLNTNIDSAPFRQNIIRCYKALVARLRDACTSVLRNPPYNNAFMKGNTPGFHAKDVEENSVLFINGELLVWLLLRFHANLQPGCNYQRRILSLQLYKETLLAFYELKNGLGYKFNQRYSSVCAFINAFSEYCNSSEESAGISEVVSDLTLPWTCEMLLWCCLDEMDDIRSESEDILRILQLSRFKESSCNLSKWFHLGLSLCNSPKTSDVESGASIVKIMACGLDFDVGSALKDSDLHNAARSVHHYLYDIVETQFEAARKNLLVAARRAPIHGSLLALGRCLCEDDAKAEMPPKESQDLLGKLLGLMVQMVEFVLSVLAKASQKGSGVAPSFAEMGESIEMVIKECKNSPVDDGEEELEPEMIPNNSGFKIDDSYEAETAISSDHALILACCWQTMKVCCLVSSMCASRWLSVLSQEQVEIILGSIVIRVLTGTRHKGAMEAARTCYSQLSVLLLNASADLGHLVHKQVDDILNQLKSGAQTSITRRAAGVAMMVQVACGAAPRTNKVLIDNTILQLLDITETEYEEQSTVDSPPVLALHILHSLVIHAPLAHHLVQHMPDITVSCLKAFGSKSWALRNAALQLYGAVVPRMVGQKKVRDDSSHMNSLTASEFLCRHAKLANYLLQLLQHVKDSHEKNLELGNMIDTNVCRGYDTSVGQSSFETVNRKRNVEISITAHSHLVPVLSLLARLSPGTGLQQNQEVSNRLQEYDAIIIHLLGSPIHTVRRLAAISLVALAPSEHALIKITTLIHSLNGGTLHTNEMHGKLLTVLEFLETYPSFQRDDVVKEPLVTVLYVIIKSNKCYINSTVALKILKLFDVCDLEISPPHISTLDLGVPLYVQTDLKLKLKHMSDEDLKKFLIEDVFSWQSIEEYFVNYLENYLNTYASSSWMKETEAVIWQKLENVDDLCSVSLVRILCIILNRQSHIEKMPSEKCMKSLALLLKGYHGAKIASRVLIILAYVIMHIHTERTKPNIGKCLIRDFCNVVSKYSSPKSTEDYRLAASTALKICIPALLLNDSGTDTAMKEQVILATLELLQDEDSVIRESSCEIVFQLRKSFIPSINTASFLKYQIQEVVHPNLELRYFTEIVVKLCMEEKNSEILKILWRITYQDKACEYRPKLSLFQSQSMNLYKEPKYCGEYIAKTFEIVFKEQFARKGGNCEEFVSDEDLSAWLRLECQAMNERGNFLLTLLQEENVILNKWLLSSAQMYITASKTILSLGSIINVQLELNSLLFFEEGKFCKIKAL